MGILNSKTGCLSISGDFAAVCPLNARSISASKFPVPSSALAASGFGNGWFLDTLFIVFDAPLSDVSPLEAFFTPPSELRRKDDEFDVREGDTRELLERSRAGGRDFISLALARDIVGAVYDVITDATISLIKRIKYHWRQVQYWLSSKLPPIL